MHNSTGLLPDWLPDLIPEESFVSIEDKVRLVNSFALENVNRRSGGPFGAAIFGADGKVFAAGVNRVVPLHNAVYHAEIVCFMEGFSRHRHFSFDTLEGAVLATLGQPCAMCMGALVWAGIKEIAISTTSEDIESIAGFDEGPVHPNWLSELSLRGIRIHQEILRDEGRQILSRYKELGGIAYNSKTRRAGA